MEATPGEGDDEPTRLHVGNLTRHVTQAHLREIFGTYGEVSHAELVVDRRVGLSKGHGFVEFQSRKDAEEVR